VRPIYVKDVCDPGRALSILVSADEPLEDVLRCFAQDSSLRSIFVTGEAGQFTGVITRTDLLNWTRLRLGTALRTPNPEPDSIIRLAQLVGAGTARDAIHPDSKKAAVHLDDPVDRALSLMLEVDIIAIPVVDDENQIMGDLTLSRVLRYLFDLEATPADPS
jgi:CBS domain-containing protein